MSKTPGKPNVPDANELAKETGTDFSGAMKEAEGFALAIFKGIIGAMDRKRKRLKMGIVKPDENRDLLVTQGWIPPVYSTASIKMALAENILPPNWSAYTTVLQGFAEDVEAMQKRLNNELRAARLLQQQKAEEARDKIDATYINKVNELYGRKMLQSYKNL